MVTVGKPSDERKGAMERPVSVTRSADHAADGGASVKAGPAKAARSSQSAPAASVPRAVVRPQIHIHLNLNIDLADKRPHAAFEYARQIRELFEMHFGREGSG